MVEFGHQPDEVVARGTLLVLDAFDEFEADDLQKVIEVVERKHLVKVVLFPHNEKTLRSMSYREVPAFHKRVKHLESLVDDLPPSAPPLRIDTYEEKRKKYTPMELILRYAEETYQGPYFLYVTDAYANLFATFASFEECMKKVRLLIEPKYGVTLSSKFTKLEKRWEIV